MVRGAHDGAITALEWVPGQPVLITSSEDNSVKVKLVGKRRLTEILIFRFQQWLFDSPTAAPRLLKFRSGHHAPPHLIRYYGDDGKQLLTSSRDRSLRCTSVVRDSRSFELSQGNSTLLPLQKAGQYLYFRISTQESHVSVNTSSRIEISSNFLNILFDDPCQRLG